MIKATFLLWLLHCGLSHFLSKKGREREDKGACVAQGPLAPPLELSPSFILSLSLIFHLSHLLPFKMAPGPKGPIEEGILQIYSS